MPTPPITAHDHIADVQIAHLAAHGDSRGRFTEIFRKEWFPQRDWQAVQMNRSDSQAGVLRGLHYHFRQVDYWYLLAGTVRVGLVDLRSWSPSYQKAATLCLAAEDNTGIFIPVGVAHGFYAVSDVTLLYVVDNYYDGGDEFGLAWNDPTVGPDWGITTTPSLSQRDAQNPWWHDIAEANRPQR